MSDYFYIRWFPSDYMRDTRRLTQAQNGAYFLLLNEYYLTGEALPDDDKVLAQISLSESLSDWRAIRSVIAGRFDIRDGKWFHKRCEEELKHVRDLAGARKRGAAKTNQARWGSLSDTLSDRSATESESESDSESKIEAEALARKAAAKPPPRPKFVPPTVEEAEAIFAENGFPGLGRKFVSHYGSQGWKRNNGIRVTDWRECINGWIEDEKHKRRKNDTQPRLEDRHRSERDAVEAMEAFT